MINCKAKIYFPVIISVLLSINSYSQPSTWNSPNEREYLKKGDKQWNKGYLHNALGYYRQAYALNPKNSYTNFQIGAIYYLSDSDKIQSFPYFKNTIKYARPLANDTIIDAYYYIGYCYMLQEKYDSAEMAFAKYGSHLETKKANRKMFKELNRNLLICYTAPRILKMAPDSTAYFINGKTQHTYVRNVGYPVNTEYPEYSQLLFNNNAGILFTSRRPMGSKKNVDNLTGEYFEDSYLSTKDSDDHWTTPVTFSQDLHLPPEKIHTATVALSYDDNTLLLYRDGSIFKFDKTNGKWGEPVDLTNGIKKLNKYYVPSAFISKDGTILLMVSDAKGGYGSKDIYMCTKNADGKWSEPKNLGPVINTSEDEDAPYLMPDNKTLFFSSKGHGGLGGYDIFVSHLDNKGNWSKPQNLGAPINSSADDIYFTYNDDDKRGYFSSSRIGGAGDMDIYTFSFICDDIDNTTLKGKIIADGNSVPTIQITDLSSRRKLRTKSISVDENGKYSIQLKPEHAYHLSITCAGYLPYNSNFRTPHQCEAFNLYQSILLSKKDDSTGIHTGQNLSVKNAFYRSEPMANNKNIKTDVDFASLISSYKDTGAIYEIDTTYFTTYTAKQRDSLNPEKPIVKITQPLVSVVANVVYFDLNSSKLEATFFPYLNSVITTLKENKGFKVSLNGYTDNTGKTFFNKRLSILRAKAVAEYLYHQDIRHSRVKYKGYGATHFAAQNDAEHSHLNRRVELQFIK